LLKVIGPLVLSKVVEPSRTVGAEIVMPFVVLVCEGGLKVAEEEAEKEARRVVSPILLGKLMVPAPATMERAKPPSMEAPSVTLLPDVVRVEAAVMRI
jgi:hypothetical protein